MRLDSYINSLFIGIIGGVTASILYELKGVNILSKTVLGSALGKVVIIMIIVFVLWLYVKDKKKRVK